MVEIRREDISGPLITAIGPSGFRVADRIVPGGLVLWPDNAFDWEPPKLEALNEAVLDKALALEPAPEFLLLGSGPTLVHPPATLRRALEARNIGLEVMDSRAAAKTWGLMRAEERWISAALYPLN
ncbi:MAG: Mth938-like domain-containing protein [Pseudomonadota bacterium]